MNTTIDRMTAKRIGGLATIAAGLFLLTLAAGCAGTNSTPPSSAAATASLPSASSATAAGPSSNQATAASGAAQSLAAGAPSSQEHLVGVGSATVVTIHGKVVAVNRAQKLVTLEGPQGKLVTLHVYNPYNLAAAKPGVPFVAKFYEIVTIRKMLPGEQIPAASVAAGIVTAMPGQTPGAVAGTRREVVVTIDAIDVADETAAVKGPDGSVETIKVANPANLKYVKPGEQIVVTLSNVVAIVLEHEAAG